MKKNCKFDSNNCEMKVKRRAYRILNIFFDNVKWILSWGHFSSESGIGNWDGKDTKLMRNGERKEHKALFG